MQKPFEDATYALEVGELSQAVSSDSGVQDWIITFCFVQTQISPSWSLLY
jgi:hypothetical protein